MGVFARKEGALFLKQWEDLGVLRGFRQSWSDKGISAVKKLERLRAFYRFALESRWIEENPSTKLKKPEVTDAPTMPFTQDEMVRILAACEQYPDNYGKQGQVTRSVAGAGAAVAVQRNAIGDAASCGTERIAGDRLLSTRKRTFLYGASCLNS
jgi:hypothetical protein